MSSYLLIQGWYFKSKTGISGLSEVSVEFTSSINFLICVFKFRYTPAGVEIFKNSFRNLLINWFFLSQTEITIHNKNYFCKFLQVILMTSINLLLSGVHTSAVSESRLSNPSHHLWVRVRVRVITSKSESESSPQSPSPSPSPQVQVKKKKLNLSHKSSSPHIQHLFIFQNMKTNNKNVSNVRVNSATWHGRYCLDSGVTRARVTISESE